MSRIKYLNVPTFLLKMAFLYPIDKDNSSLKKIAYYIWVVLFLTTFITITIQCIIYVYVTPFNLVEEATVIMNIVFYASLFIHFFLFSYNSSKLQNLVELIDRIFEETSNNEIEIIAMQPTMKITNQMSIFWLFSITLAGLTPTLTAIITGEIKLPIPTWFPYNYQKSPNFELTFLWQIFCMICLGIIYAATDMIYPSIVLLMSQQCKILASNIQYGFYKSLLFTKLSKERVEEFMDCIEKQNFWDICTNFSDVLSKINSTNFKEFNHLYMKKNLLQHSTLLEICKLVNEVMSVFLLVKCGAQMFNVVFIAFSLIIADDNQEFFGLCTYIFFASFMLLLYNYSGQIYTQNVDLSWTVYQIPWYLCDVKLQKMLILVLMKSNQIVCTKAGYYFTLSAPTFITFMRAAFSYIALLNELT